MRKLLSLLLTVVCLVSLSGCVKIDPNVVDPDPTSVPETTISAETTPKETEIVDCIDAAAVLKSAYDQVAQMDVVHITSARLWTQHVNSAEGATNEDVVPSSDTDIDRSNRKWDLWINNITGEYAVEHVRNGAGLGVTGGAKYQLKHSGVYEEQPYEYLGFGYSWKIQEDEKIITYESAYAGYNDELCYNWNVLPAMESLFIVELSDDGAYYLLTSNPVVWYDCFYSDSPYVITLRVDRDTLLFDEIVVSSADWTESASFEYHHDDGASIFYEQMPDDILNKEIDRWGLYDAPEECWFMYTYDMIREACEEDNVNEEWTVIEK